MNSDGHLHENTFGVQTPTLFVKPLTVSGAPSVFCSVSLTGPSGNVILRMLDGGGNYRNQNG